MVLRKEGREKGRISLLCDIVRVCIMTAKEERGKASVRHVFCKFQLGLPLSLLLQSLLKDPAGVSSGPPFVTHPRCSLRNMVVWVTPM